MKTRSVIVVQVDEWRSEGVIMEKTYYDFMKEIRDNELYLSLIHIFVRKTALLWHIMVLFTMMRRSNRNTIYHRARWKPTVMLQYSCWNSQRNAI